MSQNNQMKLCSKGLHHYSVRRTQCNFCHREAAKNRYPSFYEKNKERELARGRDYRKRCKAKYEASVKSYNARHPGFQRGCMLRRQYWPHLTWREALAEYDRMFKEQNGTCYICHKPETRVDHRTGKVSYLAVDHCHDTDKVRSLLCYGCNSAFGQMKEDPTSIQRLLDYAIKWNGVK